MSATMNVLNRCGWLTSVTMFVMLLAAASISNAQQPHKLKAVGQSKKIFVWKDWKSAPEASKLFDAGVNKTHPDLILGLLSCMVDKGAGYIVSDGGVFASDILIVDGPDTGCRGTVWNDYLERSSR
jgi:hypothetical protein